MDKNSGFQWERQVSNRMGRRIFLNPAECLFFLTLGLLFIGTLNIFSASFVLAGQQYGNSYHFLIRHVVGLVIGGTAGFFVYRQDYRIIARMTPIWIGIVLFLLILVPFFGVVVNGARRWLSLFFGFQVQPSEFAKLTAILLAAWYGSNQFKKGLLPTIFAWPTGVIIAFFGLIYLQPDFRTGVLIFAFYTLTLIVAGLPLWQIGAGGAVLLTGLAGIAVLAPYRMARLLHWWDPWEAQTAGGYQAVQSFLAIGSGGWWGMGGGQGISKFYYLPEAHTDFAFAVFSQEWGFIGVLLVLLLFLLFAAAGVGIARKASDSLGTYLAAGLTLYIVLQAFGNGMMISGLLPVTGIPMPFFSYGGSFMLTNLIAVGLLLSIYRVGRTAPQEEEPEELLEQPKRHNLRLVEKRRRI